MEIYKFNFDIDKAHALRDAINDREKFSIDSELEYERKKKDNAWNRLCVAMDRLEDTLMHINDMELGNVKFNQPAFDFYEFINCSYIVIECIKSIARTFKLYDSIIKSIEDSADVFGAKNGCNGNDAKFFEYIRSLCVVHPLCTNHQTEYLNGSKFHCCPFVSWTHNSWASHYRKEADLIARIYTTSDVKNDFNIKLHINEFERYLTKWINVIPLIIEGKNSYVDKKYDDLRKEKVKDLSDFNENVVEYIKYLKNEYCKRIDLYEEYILDDYIRTFEIELSDASNQKKLEKYKHAIVYSLTFVRNSLQSMCFEGFENTGIEYPDKNTETQLFIELYHPFDIFGNLGCFSYEFGKLYSLNPDDENYSYEREYIRGWLCKHRELIDNYVNFTGKETDIELYIIVKLALYFNALTQKNIINKNIPNDIKYRDHLLTETEIADLRYEEPSESTTMDVDELLAYIDKEYGNK